MSGSKEIKKFLQEEIEKMKINIENSRGVFYNSTDEDDNYYISKGDDVIDDYYAELDEDDRDSEFYENEYGNLVDLAEREAEELEDEFYDEELEDFYDDEYWEDFYDDEHFIDTIKKELQKAKKFRLSKKYDAAIEICDNLLKIDANNRYAVDLKIATLGDMMDNKAYKLAVFYMKKYATKLDFINTMFGLLQKMNHREDNFVMNLIKYCPECVEVYIDNLGESNPKRKYLNDMLYIALRKRH